MKKEPALCFLLNAKKKVLTMASAQWIGQAMLDWFPPLICGRREMPLLQLPFFLASSKTKVRCTGSELWAHTVVVSPTHRGRKFRVCAIIPQLLASSSSSSSAPGAAPSVGCAGFPGQVITSLSFLLRHQLSWARTDWGKAMSTSDDHMEQIIQMDSL